MGMHKVIILPIVKLKNILKDSNLPIQIVPSVLSTLAPFGDRIFAGLLLSTCKIPILRLRRILILCQ